MMNWRVYVQMVNDLLQSKLSFFGATYIYVPSLNHLRVVITLNRGQETIFQLPAIASTSDAFNVKLSNLRLDVIIPDVGHVSYVDHNRGNPISFSLHFANFTFSTVDFVCVYNYKYWILAYPNLVEQEFDGFEVERYYMTLPFGKIYDSDNENSQFETFANWAKPLLGKDLIAYIHEFFLAYPRFYDWNIKKIK